MKQKETSKTKPKARTKKQIKIKKLLTKEVFKEKYIVWSVLGLGILSFILCFIPATKIAAIVLGSIVFVLGIIVLVRKTQLKLLTIIATVLGLLSILVAIALQTIFAENKDETPKDSGEVVVVKHQKRNTNTLELLENSIDVKIGKFQYKETAEGVVMSLEVSITNIEEKKAPYIVTVDALEPSGKKICEDTFLTKWEMEPGETKTFKIFTDTETYPAAIVDKIKTASFKVSRVIQY